MKYKILCAGCAAVLALGCDSSDPYSGVSNKSAETGGTATTGGDSETGGRFATGGRTGSSGGRAQSGGMPAASGGMPAASGGSERPEAAPKAIPFVATVHREPLQCGKTYGSIGIARSEIELKDFRLYVYDIELIDAEGKATPYTLTDDAAFHMNYDRPDGSPGGLALLDFAKNADGFCEARGTEETHTTLTGDYPDGIYERISFRIGVPPILNHVNGSKSPAPLNAYGMQWSWASGHRHLKIEVSAKMEDKLKERYDFHPGAAGCTSDGGGISDPYTCESPLNPRIELPYSPGDQAIQVDLAQYFLKSRSTRLVRSTRRPTRHPTSTMMRKTTSPPSWVVPEPVRPPRGWLYRTTKAAPCSANRRAIARSFVSRRWELAKAATARRSSATLEQ